jgi:hypothetical protein
MESELIERHFIPLDKSWINRMGVLDLANGRDDIGTFLDAQSNLGDDLLALQRAAKVWKTDQPVDVGESGTLYRLLKFLSWKQGLDKKFILRGTLSSRKIADDPSIINLSQSELLRLDNQTSQWASAAVLAGDAERLSNAAYKLALSYEAVDHWNTQRLKGECWLPRYDKTILNQAKTYLKLLKGERPNFEPEQAEDFCFAFMFGYMTAEEGEKIWPNLRGHESDRIVEMQETLRKAIAGEPIDSRDHRAVQAVAMWGKVNKKEVKVLYPDAVNKSWPQFWSFIN